LHDVLTIYLNYVYCIVGNTDSPVLNTDNWGLFKAGAGASFEPVPYLTLKGDANVQNRSDGQSGHHFNVGAKFEAFGILVEPGLSTGSIMPTPQQLTGSPMTIPGTLSFRTNKSRKLI